MRERTTNIRRTTCRAPGKATTDGICQWPKTSGKTTTCRDMLIHISTGTMSTTGKPSSPGPARLIDHFRLGSFVENCPIVIFDELHKYPRWKQFLKGFFDTYADRVRIIVTGSSRMDIYRRGGDSLMGRYFLYRMHPSPSQKRYDPGDYPTKNDYSPTQKIRPSTFRHSGTMVVTRNHS